MLDPMYHMTLQLIKKNHNFGMKTPKFCHLLCNFLMSIMSGNETKSVNLSLVGIQFHCTMALYHPQV